MSETRPAGIVTPEAVLLEFDTAGAASRVIAALVDVLLMSMVALLLLMAIGFLSAAGGGGGATIAVIAVVVLLFLDFIGYPIAMESLWNGRTLGKAAMGLRVVTQEGGPIRFRHAAIRGIIGIVEIYVFFGSIATISVILSKRDQRLGDMVAGTLVVRERSASRRSVAVAFPSPYGYEPYVASLDVSGLTTAQYGVIRSFLLRVLELTPQARAALAVRIANPTAILIHHTPPPHVAPETFLVCVAAAYQSRQGGQFAPSPWSQAPAWAPPPPPRPPSPPSVRGF